MAILGYFAVSIARRMRRRRQLDMEHLPKSIPLWLRSYISPVTWQGDMLRLGIGGKTAPLRYISSDGHDILLTFAPIEHDEEGEVTECEVLGKRVPLHKEEWHSVVPGDTTTITIRCERKKG